MHSKVIAKIRHDSKLKLTDDVPWDEERQCFLETITFKEIYRRIGQAREEQERATTAEIAVQQYAAGSTQGIVSASARPGGPPGSAAISTNSVKAVQPDTEDANEDMAPAASGSDVAASSL